MVIVTTLVILFSIGIIFLQILGIIKATRQDYASIFVTMYRGFNVAALLKEKELKDERIKKLVILDNSVTIVLILFLVFFYFSQGITGDHVTVIAFGIITVNFLMQKLIDWRIKNIVKQLEAD